MKRISIIGLACISAGALCSGLRPAQAQSANAPNYSIEAIRVATWPDYSRATAVMGAPQGNLEIVIVMWLLRGGGRTILVDTGYHHIKEFIARATEYTPPDKALREAGAQPADVTDVIISHVHGDHLDGLDLFPNATVWIQRKEYEHYTGDAWQPGGDHRYAMPDNIMELVRRNLNNKLRLINGDNVEIIPGITVYTGVTHTFEAQYLRIAGDPPFVLAVDSTKFYENLRTHRPAGNTKDAKAELAAQERMAKLAGSHDRIIPGHDPEMFKLYPTKGHVARIR